MTPPVVKAAFDQASPQSALTRKNLKLTLVESGTDTEYHVARG